MVREPMPGPVSRAVSQDRRLAPSTSWVAFSARAKVEQGLGDVVADHLVVGAAHRFDQAPLAGQRGRIGAGQAVGLGDVHGQQVAARPSAPRSGPPA